jgi:hypothetical protein
MKKFDSKAWSANQYKTSDIIMRLCVDTVHLKTFYRLYEIEQHDDKL